MTPDPAPGPARDITRPLLAARGLRAMADDYMAVLLPAGIVFSNARFLADGAPKSTPNTAPEALESVLGGGCDVWELRQCLRDASVMATAQG